MTIQTAFACIFGFAFGFYWGWEFTLILIGSVPFMCCTGMFFAAAMANIGTKEMRAYA